MSDATTQSCTTCTHHHGDGGQYECRAHPPSMHPITQQGITGPRLGFIPVIPVVAPTYWCGEWRRDPRHPVAEKGLPPGNLGRERA